MMVLNYYLISNVLCGNAGILVPIQVLDYIINLSYRHQPKRFIWPGLNLAPDHSPDSAAPYSFNLLVFLFALENNYLQIDEITCWQNDLARYEILILIQYFQLT